MEARLTPKEPLKIGWREWVGLPDLGVGAIKAKIDTGARTSALHAYQIEPFRRGGALWLRFKLHPIQRSEASKVTCEACAIDERTVRNSGGGVERRYIVKTLLKLGEQAWSIELALANRDQMGFRPLLPSWCTPAEAAAAARVSFKAEQITALTIELGQENPNEDRVARAQSPSL
jgi:hypothetical protein